MRKRTRYLLGTTRELGTHCSLIETSKLIAVDQFIYLSATLTAIVNGHQQSGIGELLPSNYSRKSNG